MKKAFTLIELLITLAIIAMVTVLGIPAFSKYGERARFDQKASEIKFALDEVHLKMLNPESDAINYSLEYAVDGGLDLKKDDTVYRHITVSAKDSLSAIDFYKMVCVVATKVCGKGDESGDTTVPDYQFLRFKNTSTGRTVLFTIKNNPFGIIVKEEVVGL